MSYMERRCELEDLMQQAARIIRREPCFQSRALLIERCADTLQAELERPDDEQTVDPGVLRDCFVESVDRWLALENDSHSVRVPTLRVVR